MAVQPRGKVTIDAEECKGCGLCIASCPPQCLELAPELNANGVHPARCTRTHLHRVRHLLLLLPGARRNHCLPHEGNAFGREGGQTCANFVRETWRW